MSIDTQNITESDYYSCFISCSSRDYPFAERLYTDLQWNGVRCWFALQDLRVGENFRHSIDNAIRKYEKLLVVLSKHSVASSWVEMEVSAAIEKERREQRTVLLPIRLDNTILNTPQRWANLIRRRHIGDFTHWESPSDYQKALNQILRTLKVAPSVSEVISPLRIHILETPLTAQNLVTITSALTELSTKYWLIAKGRFADLIEYTQTHNGRFAEEANVLVTRINYNSPFNMDWKVDLSAPSVAEALVTTIDGIAQRQERLEKAKLENQAKALEMKEVEQKAEQENQTALLEQEKQRLQLEQRRLEVLEKQLEVQKKGIEYALEIAEKVVDTLHPGVDPATRAMEIQALLPNLIQLQNGKGLQLVLPAPPESTA